MNEPDKEGNKKPGGLETAITLPAKYVMSAIGVVLSVSGFVALVTTQSAVISWLKNTEMTVTNNADFPADVLDALENTSEFSRTQPVGFDDAQLARSFDSLLEAITGFCRTVDNWTLVAHARQLKGMMAPPPGTFGLGEALSGISNPSVSPHVVDADMEEETTALTHRHHELVKAYDHFIRTAHARGIDIGG